MPPRTRTGKLAATFAAVLALGTSLLAGSLPAGAAPTAVTAVTDHCAGQCADILPPGANGNATLADILGNKLFGTHPAHSDDQLDRYTSLISGQSTLTDAKLTDFFNDASFGVPSGQVESVTSPAATSPSPGTRRPASRTSSAPPATAPSSAPGTRRARTGSG